MILDIMAIPLTQGLYALVDGKDYDWLMQRKWWAVKGGRSYYAVRQVGEKRKTIWMHREILNTPQGSFTDHINHNGLDNRKQNLRICTHSQNLRNQKLQQERTSKYKGVSWQKNCTMWVAFIGYKGKKIYLGAFDNEIEAAKKYDQKAKELFGEFAYTNFPQ